MLAGHGPASWLLLVFRHRHLWRGKRKFQPLQQRDVTRHEDGASGQFGTSATMRPERKASEHSVWAGAVLPFLETTHSRGLVWRLTIAGLAALAGLALQTALLGSLGSGPSYTTFYPAIAIGAAAGRLSGGLFALGLSAILAHTVVAPLETTADWLGLLTFLVNGVLITGLVEVLQVIATGRRHDARQAQELAETQELLGSIVGSTDDAVMAFDTNGRITSWNRAAQALFGYSEQEALGREADLLIKPLGRILPGRPRAGPSTMRWPARNSSATRSASPRMAPSSTSR